MRIIPVDLDRFDRHLPKGSGTINFAGAVKVLCAISFLLGDLGRAVNQLISAHNLADDAKSGRMPEVEPETPFKNSSK